MSVARRAPATAAVVALLVAACGGGSGEPEVIGTTVADAEAITVVATDFAFAPATLELAAGEPVNLTLDVEDGGHNLGVRGTEFLLPIRDEPDAVVGTLVIAEPGTYEFVCTVPGHEGQGMVGTITVR